LTLDTGDRAGAVACVAAMAVVEGSIVDSGALVEVSVVDAASAMSTLRRAMARIEEVYIMTSKEVNPDVC
jgi:hypothetical protein